GLDEAGDIFNAGSLEAWLIDLLDCGAPRPPTTGLRFLRSTRSPSPSPVRRASARDDRQGAAFVAAARAAWDCEALKLAEEERVAYPVAVAAATAGHRLPPSASLEAFILALTGNFVSAVVRLGPIGQTKAQKILAALLPRVRALGREAASATLDGLGGRAFRSDIARHAP
ncbi:MAG TPA: urease accessory UreF family protein, partial [Roseiarcus sp.]|nr:urease accessory UreF family protein [Roseiarcus sp.]